MLLTEQHVIKRSKNEVMYLQRDQECFLSKNLYNATNYRIKQAYRIHLKLKNHQRLEPWESELLFEINKEISLYNQGKDDDKKMQYIDNFNGFLANAYFLCFYMAQTDNSDYRAMPYSTAAQICIQNLCKDWKSFYKKIKNYKNNPSKYTGKPNPPDYKDKENGRNAITLTYQQLKKKNGILVLPKYLKGMRIRTDKENIKQFRYYTTKDAIRIDVIYEIETKTIFSGDTVNYMAIDLGVNNLAALTFSNEYEPAIINGKPLKSINQYYHKKKAVLQSEANKAGLKTTDEIEKLTKKHNNKVNDFIHKASKIIVDLAVDANIDIIVIGHNKEWKNKSDMGNQSNQNFVSIPHTKLIELITYKANIHGIKVIEVNESYTSGTSCLDNEKAIKKNYNKDRRVHRGLFISNKGSINADVNASYQIMRKKLDITIHEVEKVRRINIPFKLKKKSA